MARVDWSIASGVIISTAAEAESTPAEATPTATETTPIAIEATPTAVEAALGNSHASSAASAAAKSASPTIAEAAPIPCVTIEKTISQDTASTAWSGRVATSKATSSRLG